MQNHNYKYAPVLVTVYNRLSTLRRCIEALKSNKESSETDLFVASDAAGREEDVRKIKEIRDYVGTIEGFNSVTLIARSENWGSNRSVMTAIANLVNEYGSLIFMEDDILPSKCYLSYMNRGLDVYRDEPKVFAICGYKSNFKIPKSYKYDLFVLNRYSPWGVGFWKDKFNAVNHGAYDRYHELQLHQPEMVSFMQKNDPIFLGILKNDSAGRLQAADVRIEQYLLMTGKFCIYPIKTTTNVMDTGGVAEHCTTYWNEEEVLWNHIPTDFGKIPLSVNDMIYKRFLKEKYPNIVRRFFYALRHKSLGWVFNYYRERLSYRFHRVVGRAV